MEYTDYELKRASQIAYYKINNTVFEDIKEEIKKGNLNDDENKYTLRNLYNHSETFSNSLFENIKEVAKSVTGIEDISFYSLENKDNVLAKMEGDKTIQSRVREMYETIEAILDESADSIGNWKVISFVDNNTLGTAGVVGFVNESGTMEFHEDFSQSGNGMAAIMFDTGDGNSLLAFRGSEGMDDANHILTDWIAADAGLVLPTDTAQHQSVEKYMMEYILKMKGYDSLAITGHSLGGESCPTCACNCVRKQSWRR